MTTQRLSTAINQLQPNQAFETHVAATQADCGPFRFATGVLVAVPLSFVFWAAILLLTARAL